MLETTKRNDKMFVWKTKWKLKKKKNVHNSKLDDMENLPINTFYPYCWNLLCFFWHTLTQLLKSFCALLTHPNIHTLSWYIHIVHIITHSPQHIQHKKPRNVYRNQAEIQKLIMIMKNINSFVRFIPSNHWIHLSNFAGWKNSRPWLR